MGAGEGRGADTPASGCRIRLQEAGIVEAPAATEQEGGHAGTFGGELKTARRGERHACGGFPDDAGEASGPRSFFHRGEDLTADVEIDDALGSEAGARQTWGIGVRVLLNPEHRPIPARQDACNEQSRGGSTFGTGAEAGNVVKTGPQAVARQAIVDPRLGRAVPAVQTTDGVRALKNEKPTNPESIARCVQKAFGDHLDEARTAIEGLARSLAPADLAKYAYHLYEQFRPSVPPDVRGWGAKGDLDLAAIADLVRSA